jgi:hypothetical protein
VSCRTCRWPELVFASPIATSRSSQSEGSFVARAAAATAAAAAGAGAGANANTDTYLSQAWRGGLNRTDFIHGGQRGRTGVAANVHPEV